MTLLKKIFTQTTDWEKIPANHISDKGLVVRIYKELPKFKIKPNLTHNM